MSLINVYWRENKTNRSELLRALRIWEPSNLVVGDEESAFALPVILRLFQKDIFGLVSHDFAYKMI